MRRSGEDRWDDGGAAANRATLSSEPRPSPPLVLALSLTPTSTGIALFRGADTVRAETIVYEARGSRHVDIGSVRDERLRSARAFLAAGGLAPGALAAVAVHADSPRPVEAGTYRIEAAMLRAAQDQCTTSWASLAAVVAHELAQEWRCPALAVDPTSFVECASDRSAAGRCGRSLAAMKGAARRHARAVDRPLEALRLVAVHLGAGVSLCVQSAARIGDVQHTIDPLELDLEEALDRAEAGDGHASAVLHDAASRIAKGVGALATVLEGEVDAVLVTGSLERAGLVVAEICRRVEWIAPVFLYRDEDELSALARGAHAVLAGEEPLKQYA